MPQSKEIFGTDASLQKSTLRRSNIRDPQLPNFQSSNRTGDSCVDSYDLAPRPCRKLQSRRRRRRAARRRPFRRLRWAISSLRNALARLWFRLPVVSRLSKPTASESFSDRWESEHWESEYWESGACESEQWDHTNDPQAQRIFPSRSRPKKRKGKPEGTKGAGSRSL